MLRVVAGGLFLFSAWNKLSPAGILGQGPLTGMHFFAQSMRRFDILPEELVPLAVYGIPWTEAVVGLCLVAGWWTRAAGRLGLLLLLTFTLAVAWVRYQQGPGLKCGCFGRFQLICTEGVSWCKVGENLVLMALFWIPAFRGSGRYTINAADASGG